MIHLDASALAARLDRRDPHRCARCGVPQTPCRFPGACIMKSKPPRPARGQARFWSCRPGGPAAPSASRLRRFSRTMRFEAYRPLPRPTCCSTPRTGQPRALLEGAELTLRRTGAASALASRHLALADASRLAMVGTGRLAPHLIESHAAVRPIREVRIWGRHSERARSLAAALDRPGLSVEAAADLEAAVRWADIVSCATLSRQPLVLGAWLKPGQHLDLVGAFTPQMCRVRR